MEPGGAWGSPAGGPLGRLFQPVEYVAYEVDCGQGIAGSEVGRNHICFLARQKTGTTGGDQSLPLLFHGGQLPLAGFFQASGANELNRAAQLVFIEPGAVGLADIHDHAGAMGEVHAVHQLVAHRARHIADIFFHVHGFRRRCGHAQHRGLLFAVRTDLLQCGYVHPKALALGTFAQVVGPDHHGFQSSLASRTELLVAACDLGPGRARAAMGAELRSGEHHPEARRTGHRGQSAAAVLAPCGFA